jgi:hypothetical protein
MKVTRELNLNSEGLILRYLSGSEAAHTLRFTCEVLGTQAQGPTKETHRERHGTLPTEQPLPHDAPGARTTPLEEAVFPMTILPLFRHARLLIHEGKWNSRALSPLKAHPAAQTALLP